MISIAVFAALIAGSLASHVPKEEDCRTSYSNKSDCCYPDIEDTLFLLGNVQISVYKYHKCKFSDMGTDGVPVYGLKAKMCAGHKKHQKNLYNAMNAGSFGRFDGVDGGGTKDCGAWCLYDLHSEKGYFRWKDTKKCWKFWSGKKGGECIDADGAEVAYGAHVRDNLCAPTSCMAGRTEVLTITDSTVNDHDYDDHEEEEVPAVVTPDVTSDVKITTPKMVTVENLNIGDKILGLDASKRQQFCNVVAVGQFGSGTVYGNYTKDHFVLDTAKGNVVMHGAIGEEWLSDKYGVLSDCPIGVDTQGVGFTAIDSDFCGVGQEEISWSDYVALHTAILRAVRQSGPYWFSAGAYADPKFSSHTPKICAAMLKCIREDDCEDLENVGCDFINNVLTADARDQTKKAFPDMGDSKKKGSLAYTISGKKPFIDTITGTAVITAGAVLAIGIILTIIFVVHRRSTPASVQPADKMVSPIVEKM